MTLVYQTNVDGYFTGAIVADQDPLDDTNFLIPRGCVTVDPPDFSTNQIPRFVDGAWEIVANFKGMTYWNADGSSVTIQEFGVSPPDGALSSQPYIPPTPEQIRQTLSAAVEAHLNDYAQTWGYNTVYTAATYLTSHISKFQAEAQALVTWRDDVWYFVEDLDVRVSNGSAQPPADSAALVALLPTPPTRPVV